MRIDHEESVKYYRSDARIRRFGHPAGRRPSRGKDGSSIVSYLHNPVL